MTNNNQTAPVTDEELDQMIWKLERDGMTPKQLSLMRELREVRRAVTPTDDERIMAIEGIAPPAPVVPDEIAVALIAAIEKEQDRLFGEDYMMDSKDCVDVIREEMERLNACRAAMLQVGNSRGTPDEQSFWNWLRDEMPTTYRWSRELEDTPENSALITKGKASALDMLSAWKGCSAAMQLSGNSEQLEPVSNRDELPAKCWCHTCRPVTMNDMRFVVCPECGNKRCPRANDHRNACTGSNAPGQDGSAYPAAPKEVG